MKQEKIINYQFFLNKNLASIMKMMGISKIRLTSFGNSIASGYSMVRTTKPLLLRNESLEQIMHDNGIILDIHHFARAQNNNDEKFNEWIITNIKESVIHEMNQNDYGHEKTSLSTNGLSQKLLKEYYPLKLEADVGLKDIITDSTENLANIVIYNGCTGSFLDNITRDGKLSKKLLSGIRRDLVSLEANLKFIQNSNRKFASNTQVYICGVPNFLGLNISEIINTKLRKIANEYSNTTYVESVKSKFLYKKYTDEKNKHRLSMNLDIHYDEIEYLKLNNNIIESIIENYSIKKSMINIDRIFYHFSSEIELNNQHLIEQSADIRKIINEILDRECLNLNVNEKKKMFNKLKKYIENRLPYDFYYIGKDNFDGVMKIKRKQ